MHLLHFEQSSLTFSVFPETSMRGGWLKLQIMFSVKNLECSYAKFLIKGTVMQLSGK